MKILLLGDVSPTAFSKSMFASEQVEALFDDCRALFDAADFSFVNLECAITDSEEGITKFGPCLSAPRGTAATLKKLGVDCCGLSNNHIFDFGRKGVKDTIRALEEEGISYTGFGENELDARRDFILEKGGERIAILAVCEHEYSYALEDRMGARAFDPFDTMLDIRRAKENSDRVIVLYHGGKELSRYPSPRVRKLFRAMAEHGADVVIGQHSHCIATYECYQGAHLLHGQGNFHFYKESLHEGWNECMAMTYDTQTGQVEWTPLTAFATGICQAKGEVKEEMLSRFFQRNESLKDGTWKNGWRAFCLSEKEKYVKAIARAQKEDSTHRENARFGHYLDCEAHTDVWRELFPTYNMTNERD